MSLLCGVLFVDLREAVPPYAPRLHLELKLRWAADCVCVSCFVHLVAEQDLADVARAERRFAEHAHAVRRDDAVRPEADLAVLVRDGLEERLAWREDAIARASGGRACVTSRPLRAHGLH